jgi:hypothetical protein
MSQPGPEEKFVAALSDVVWRFHAYDQSERDPKKAVKALMKRVPEHFPEFYLEQFALHLKLLLATIEAVHEAPKHFKPENKTSRYSNVDPEYAIHKLRSLIPEQPDDFLNGYLGMVIYWYYLR